MRSPLKMGDIKLVDTMVLDGLTDAFNDYHMGITGEKSGQSWLYNNQCLSVEPGMFCNLILQ